MLKSLMCVTACLLFLFVRLCVPARCAEISVSARSAALYCVDTGEFIFTKNENERLPMASTTKIMTALIALEQNTPGRLFTVSRSAVLVEGSSSGLKSGDVLTLEDTVKCMLLESGNEAANVTAISLGGSLEGFAEIMNRRARELNMLDTYFVTPSGLDAQGHCTTAHDMALLAAQACQTPEFMRICSLKSGEATASGRKITLFNHNRLLSSLEGCTGMKTGFTKKSGRCLVSSATRNGVTLVCVTLNAPDDWSDHEKLHEYGFSVIKTHTASPKLYYGVRIAGANGETASVRARSKLLVLPVNAGGEQVEYEVYLEKFVYAPVEDGDVLGYIEYRCLGRLLAREPLYADAGG